MLNIDDRLLILGVTGSQAYGLAIEGVSDVDIKGIFVADKSYYLGLKQIEQIEGKGDLGVFTNHEMGNKGVKKLEFVTNKFDVDLAKDFVLYELKKYLDLLGNANPNIQEILWLDEYIYLHPLSKILIDNRDRFLTKKVRSSYIGYANAQLKKVETHRRWLLNPPQREPKAEDFGFKDLYKPLSLSELNAFFNFLWLTVRDCIDYIEPAEELRDLLLEKIDFKQVFLNHRFPDEADRQIQEYTYANSDYMRLTYASRHYLGAKREWQNYQSWLKYRNPNRKGLEAKIGYDCKHASHALRLLYTGREIIKNKVLTVDRRRAGDAEYLLAIKQGYIPYDEVMKECNRVYSAIENIDNKDIDLPDCVDNDFLSNLCVEIVEKMGF
jgi:uncharacterized protein